MASGNKRRSANRPVRVEDVARVAGVSPITVSRALSYPEKVREETRQRILAAVAETGYVVNHFASSLRSGRSSIVTVFVSSLLNPHFATSIQGIVEAFEGSGFHLMFAQIGYTELVEIDVVNNAMPFRPAGVIFTGIIRAEKTRELVSRLDDEQGFAAEAAEGRSLGFDGKSLIHPDQIAPCHAAFAPTDEEIERAERLVSAATGGAERFEGEMVEAMHVEAARRLLARASRS